MKKSFTGKAILKIIGVGLLTLITIIATLAITVLIIGGSSMLIWNKVFAPATGFGVISFKQALALGAYLYILKIWVTTKRSNKDEQ